MARLLALALLVLAAAPARAQSANDPERTSSERFDEVESTAWSGTLDTLERISAMLDRLDVPTETRKRQDHLATVANASSATRGALFILLQFTATRLDRDAALQPLAEAALGLVDLLGETAFEASADALNAAEAPRTLDGPAQATRIRALADVIRQSTPSLGIALP